MLLSLNLIRTDGDTQSREQLVEETYLEYAEAMLAGEVFPPVVVFHDGVDYWLADGFHRARGADHAGLAEIEADVRPGSQADAQLFSFAANNAHGLRRSNADKRRAVTGALKHPVSSKWSDNQIAKHCGVSQPFVSGIRGSLQTVISENAAERTYTTRHGTVAVMKTAGIGKKLLAQESAVEDGAGAMSTASGEAASSPPNIPSSQPSSLDGMGDEDFAADVDPLQEVESVQRQLRDIQAIVQADDKMAEADKWRRLHQVAEERQSKLLRDLSRVNGKLFITSEALKKIARALGREDPRGQQGAINNLVATVQRIAREARKEAA